MSVYLGLLSVAWSQHSSEDLLVLLKNAPHMETWYNVVGGGVEGKKGERVTKNIVSQTLETVGKKFRKPKRPSASPHSEDSGGEVFVAPKKTLLDQFLSPPPVEASEGDRKQGKGVRPDPGEFFLVGGSSEDEGEERGRGEGRAWGER